MPEYMPEYMHHESVGCKHSYIASVRVSFSFSMTLGRERLAHGVQCIMTGLCGALLVIKMTLWRRTHSIRPEGWAQQVTSLLGKAATTSYFASLRWLSTTACTARQPCARLALLESRGFGALKLTIPLLQKGRG